MTVSSTTRIAGPYAGNAATTLFPFAFKVFSATDVAVYSTTANVTTLLTQGTAYTVLVNPDQAVAPGGTITMLAAPATGTSITIGSVVPMTQPLALPGGGSFNPVSIENALDRTVILIQQLLGNAGSAISVQPGETIPLLPNAAARAGLLLSFDANGNPIVVAPASGSAAALATDLANAANAAKGAGLVGLGAGLSYPAGTVGSVLNSVVYANAYVSVSVAVAAAAGRKLVFGPGAYSVTATLDCGTATLEFLPGALLTVSAGQALIIRSQVIAGDYQIFAQTGLVISLGDRNPMWWGATRGSPGTVAPAQNNTIAFRKAAMSYFAEYAINSGTVAVPAYQIPFNVRIPAGVFQLANGFAAAVGVKVFGQGMATMLQRIPGNYDPVETAIPLLTVGQTLAASPGLAYQNDPTLGASLSCQITPSGGAQPAACARDIQFIDTNGAGTFCPKYPGAQFNDLFFTSCNISMLLSNTADMTGNNLIFDQGQSHIALDNCQNIVLSNIVSYQAAAQVVAISGNVRDVQFIGGNIEYPLVQGVNFGTGAANDNIHFVNWNFTGNVQYGGWAAAVRVATSGVKAFFRNCTFRNLPGPSFTSAGSLTGIDITLDNCTFDGLKTFSGYAQSVLMSGFQWSSGKLRLRNTTMQNLLARSVIGGTAAVIVDGLDYSGMATAGSVIDLSGTSGGDAQFFNVKGDGITPFFTGATFGLANVRMKGGSDWLGGTFVDGSFNAWYMPLPAYGQVMVTVSAQPDATASVRKSATAIFEKSVEALPTVTDTITSATLFASPTANGHAAATPTMVFNSTGTTADTTSPGTSKAARLRVPLVYSTMSANVDYLA